MNIVGIVCAVLLLLTGLLCLIRIVRGPSMLDRTVAVDVFVAACLGAVGVHAAIFEYDTTLPILLALSLVAFLGSVSIARYAAPKGTGEAELAEPHPDFGHGLTREDGS